jgi:serine phosphatase RsbU (regulator of sigma subunit)
MPSFSLPTRRVGRPLPVSRSKLFRVLLIEKDQKEVELIRRLLSEAEGVEFEIESANSLQAALKRLPQGGIDVVLLDLAVTPSSKIDAFLQIQRCAAPIPVVVLANLEDEQASLQASWRGAADYLVKGLTESNILVRSLRFAIEQQRRRRAEHDLNIAQENMRLAWETRQQRSPMTLELPGFEIGGCVYPAEVTGGDFFDYIRLPDGSTAVVIADVSGHGISPATRMAETRAYLRAFAQTEPDFNRILERVNAALFNDPLGTYFVTLILIRLDVDSRWLHFIGAGHPTAYLCSANGQVKSYLHSSGPPVGVVRDCPWPPATVHTLAPGDMALLLTDGILEAVSPGDITFGHQRALRLLRMHAQEPAQQIVEAIYQAARDFGEYLPERDDKTAVVIKCLAAG